MHRLPAALTPEALSRALWLLAGAVLAATALLAYRSAPGRSAQPDLTPAPAPEAAGEAVQHTSGRPDYLDLARSPLFGERAGPPDGATPQLAPGIESAVVGTVVRGQQSVAIVQKPGGAQELLRVGDVLEGARLVDVGRTSVVLERSGTRFSVPVQRSGQRGAATATARAPAAGERRHARSNDPEEATSEPSADELELGEVDLGEFDEFYGGLRDEVQALSVRRAGDAEGATNGLVAEQVPEGGTLWRMGLRPGDVIIAVNDASVRDAQDLTRGLDRVAEQIRSEEEFFLVFDLRRDGKAEAIIIPIW